jgi:hypothetical protein
MITMKKAFRLFTMVLLSTLFSKQINAQTKYIGNSGTMSFFEIYDTEGNRIKSAGEMGINGTPLLRPGWGTGIVQYLNGTTLAFKTISFSLMENKLYYIQNKKLFIVAQPITSFDIKYANEEGDSVAYHFKNGFPFIDNQDPESLYEVLYEGENLQLLQWNHKKIKEMNIYGSGREKEFFLDQQLYVYQPKEQKIAVLKQALPAIKKTLPAYADIIKTYFATHTASIKDKEDLVYLMAYLDKHH